ncbi:MAG: triose-phosphate isomerase [Dehalococcoidia bacterium]|nr:triose-phosphate isomerase [Dehalococcoidia bacterium]
MARLPIVGGNWKMNTTRAEARALLGGLRALDGLAGVEVVICPPAPWLGDAADLLAGTTLRVGAQNVHWEPKGAFTGEVAAPMLAGTATYAIVGHSERRHVFHEKPTETNRKLRAVVEAGLRPILAIGERLAEAEAGRTEEVLRRQLTQAFRGFRALPESLVVAYEPVWAIGTGRAATPEDAQARCALVRAILAERFGRAAAEACRIQYGGSVTAQNIEGLAAQPDIDGALVGGASLDAAAFAAICRAVATAG